MLQWSSHSQNLFCQIFWQEFEAEMKLSGLSWRSCEGSKWVIGLLQAGRSTRYPATIEAPVIMVMMMMMMMMMMVVVVTTIIILMMMMMMMMMLKILILIMMVMTKIMLMLAWSWSDGGVQVVQALMMMMMKILVTDDGFKTESIRKLSNFNFQWTKTMYQNNLNNIAFFFTFFKDYKYN